MEKHTSVNYLCRVIHFLFLFVFTYSYNGSKALPATEWGWPFINQLISWPSWTKSINEAKLLNNFFH